ncbi:MAG: TonB-dependent hemoglobin/transferrin/lactoferrin family receptor [Hyphomicrobiaceae bacterium]|nr:TonB-dependent hemoglobin/transferrin/lactoferrin family receptor [Hyphomicrobiaceae bacterium]
MGTASAVLSLFVAGERAVAQDIALDGIVVTSTKTGEAAIDAMSGTSIVGAEQLEQQFAPESVSEVLRTMPGVTTQTTGRDTGVAVNIRGLQDFGRVNVLIDGVRQNFQRSGHSANGVVYVEPEMLSGIEVTKGPSATIYGSGAIGGVAQFKLIDADDILRPGESQAAQVTTRWGSNGPQRLASATGAIKVGNFDIVGQVNGRWNDNYEDGDGNEILNSNDETDSRLVKARLRPAPGHEITGTFIDFDSSFTDRVEPDQGTRRDSNVDNKQFSLGYTFKSSETDLIDLDAKVYSNRTRLDQERLDSSTDVRYSLTGSKAFVRVFDGAVVGPPFAPIVLPPVILPLGDVIPGLDLDEATAETVFVPAGASRSVEVQTRGFDVFNTSRFAFGDAKVALTYGADGFVDRVESVDIFDNQDEFTPGGERRLNGGFLQSQLTLFGLVDVIGALRYDSYELAGNGVSASDDRVSPKITVGVTPVPGITLFSTFAEGFRAPSVSETLTSGLHPPPADFLLIPNANLRPEVAENIEAGINFKADGIFTANDAFRMKVVGFRSEIEDYIEGVSLGNVGIAILGPASFDNPIPVADLGDRLNGIVPIFASQFYQYQNLASVLIEGVEVEAAYDARAWFASLGAAHLRGINQETGEGLRSVPADQVTLTTGIRAFDEKLVAGTRTRFVANQERFTESSDLGAFRRADGYVVVDLFSHYVVSDNLAVTLNIDNVFDKQYRQHLDQDASAGLNARLGMTMRLGAP